MIELQIPAITILILGEMCDGLFVLFFLTKDKLAGTQLPDFFCLNFQRELKKNFWFPSLLSIFLSFCEHSRQQMNKKSQVLWVKISNRNMICPLIYQVVRSGLNWLAFKAETEESQSRVRRRLCWLQTWRLNIFLPNIIIYLFRKEIHVNEQFQNSWRLIVFKQCLNIANMNRINSN